MIIEIDGLPVEVDQQAYEQSPDSVIQTVRLARAAVVGDQVALHGVSPTYDELSAFNLTNEEDPA